MGSSPQPTPSDLMDRALCDLTRRTGMPVAFGGFESQQSLEVTNVVGNRTPLLNGLIVRATRGLGGRAMVEQRPRLALDYRSSRQITHDYDHAILGEGIATLFAVPVLVGGRSRAVLYAGTYARTAFGEDVARTAMSVATDLATEIRIHDEVARQLSVAMPAAALAMSPSAREQLRETYADLRGISADVSDPSLRRRLGLLEQRLASLTSERSDDALDLDVRLSPRETDVLACAALGQTNAEIAATLHLKEGTVKSYLQAAMSKLDASTRHAAVARARLAGLLP